MKKFTFRQKHAFDFIQRKLVYFVISNSLQKVITQAEFFVNLSTDRSAGPVTISISKSKNRIHGHGFWKFNSFLLSDKNMLEKQKTLFKPFTVTIM